MALSDLRFDTAAASELHLYALQACSSFSTSQGQHRIQEL
jgi:hypothetical protein